MKKKWARFTNPDESVLRSWLDSEDAGELQYDRLHPVARDALFGYNGQLRDPFPRIESHGHYVFGMLAVPTSIHDAKSEFCVLHFAADIDEMVTVLRSSQNFDVSQIEDALAANDPLRENPEANTGLIFAKIAEVFISAIEASTDSLKDRVQKDIRGAAMLRNSMASKDDTVELASLHRQAVSNQMEVLGLKTLVEETKNLLTAIAEDKVDVKRTADSKSEDLFPRFVEILIMDLLMRARHQKAIHSNLQEDMDLVFNHHHEIQGIRQTAAAKRFSGMLSILLFPQLIVAFFGQSFRNAPLYDNKFGWLISLVRVAFVSLLQYIFFKRKRWL